MITRKRLLIIFSVFLNFLFGSMLFGWYFVVLFILVVSLFASVWLNKRYLNTMNQLRDNLVSYSYDMQDFLEHLDEVYEYTIYYENEAIGQLLDHSKVLYDKTVDFIEMYDSTLLEDEENDPEEELVEEESDDREE